MCSLIMDPWIISLHISLLLTRLITKRLLKKFWIISGAVSLCKGRGDMMNMTWFNRGGFPLSEPFFSCPVHLFRVQTPEQWQLPESYKSRCLLHLMAATMCRSLLQWNRATCCLGRSSSRCFQSD